MSEYGGYRPGRKVQSIPGVEQELRRIGQQVNFPVPVLDNDPPNPGDGAVWILIRNGVMVYKARFKGKTYEIGSGPSTPTEPTEPTEPTNLVAESQDLTTPHDTPKNIILTGTDPEPGPGPLTFAITSFPLGGTLSGTPPGLTYTPNEDFAGVDSFTFTVSDGDTTSPPGTIRITVETEVGTPGACAPGCCCIDSFDYFWDFNQLTPGPLPWNLELRVFLNGATVPLLGVVGAPFYPVRIIFNLGRFDPVDIVTPGGSNVQEVPFGTLVTDPFNLVAMEFDSARSSPILIARLAISGNPPLFVDPVYHWKVTLKTVHPLTGLLCGPYGPWRVSFPL